MSTDKDTIEAGRAQLSKLRERMNEITSTGFKRTDGGIDVSTSNAVEFKSALAEAKEIQALMEGLEAKSRLEEYLDSPATESVTVSQAGQARVAAEYKSFGQRFVESKEFKDRKRNGDMYEAFSISDTEMTSGPEFKDIHSGSVGTFTHPGFGRVERAPMLSAPQQRERVRDLFPQLSTNAIMIEYVEELGFVDPGDNAAAPVAERTEDNSNFGLKPKSNIHFETKTTPVRTLAHWIPAHRNTLDDEPQLRGIIDTRLMYGLKLEEDRQLLNGDGVGENLLGLLNTPGIQQYPGGNPGPNTDTVIDMIRRAMTRVQLAEYEPTGIVVHPSDWEEMELTKDADGRYIVTTTVTIGAERRLWRLPVVSTPAIPEGTALVGAFGLGAQVFDRMQGNIRTSEHHADFFVRNAIVVLAEERLGLAVYRPESMVEVTLG